MNKVTFDLETVQRMIAEAVKAEREACAKKFVGLTEDEILEAWHWGGAGIEGAHFKVLYNYFENKLREKNEN